MTSARSIQSVVCLGCGCACDDLEVTVRDGRIVDVSPECRVARAWFGDGSVPAAVTVEGRPTAAEKAVAEAAAVLARASRRALVYIGPELTAEAQRVAVAIADRIGARIDTATSAPAASGLLAAQRRGRAGATLGEIRNRADVILFWAVDPRRRYPRFLSRFIEAVGTHAPSGGAGRRLISVSVGADRAPAGADLEISLTPGEELAALSVMRATVLGNALGDLDSPLHAVADAAALLGKARYAAIVNHAEPAEEAGNPLRAEGLIALAQALNGPTRAVLVGLRAGGNRSGAEAVLTWQTGYPMAVDYSGGFPRYAPEDRGLERLREAGAVLIAGSAAELAGVGEALGTVPTIVIGPRASEAPFPTRVAIDTGVAGIHDGGIGYRLDEIPLPLRPPLANGGTRSAAEALGALLKTLRARADGRPR
jgi:formylmethanofuran dehydrogenase subunit B